MAKTMMSTEPDRGQFPYPAKARKAYTLLELCLVIFVIILTGFLVLPHLMSSVSDWDLKTEAQKIQMVIREVQKMAETKREIHQIIFDCTNDAYRVEDDGSNELMNVSLKQGISIDSTEFSIMGEDILGFDKQGVPSEGGDIVLSDLKGETISINVTPKTGRVNLQ
jgi:type II secretory pathway pseudopilin PulG